MGDMMYEHTVIRPNADLVVRLEENFFAQAAQIIGILAVLVALAVLF